LISCNPSTYRGEEHVLARVDDEYLYESDLERIIPEGSSARDSLILVKNFINNWIKQKLLVKQAERNLTREQKDFSKQMEEYRNSLIIYEYERKFIQQELDTVVSEEEIENYFNQFKHNFMARDDIYQVEYIKMDKSSNMIDYFRELLGSGSPEQMDTLEHLCPAHALSCNLDDNIWFSISDIQRKFPFYAFHQKDFAEVNKILEITDEDEVYLMVFRQYIPKGDTAPLGYISDDIREIIINKRKAELIKTMHEGVMNQAIQKKTFEIY
jgi:hypothetical protein